MKKAIAAAAAVAALHFEPPETKFSRWVKTFGVADLAAKMTALDGITLTTSAIYQHLRGETEPRPTKARGYVKLSGGKLKFQDIHDHVEAVRASRAQREDLARP